MMMRRRSLVVGASLTIQGFTRLPISSTSSIRWTRGRNADILSWAGSKGRPSQFKSGKLSRRQIKEAYDTLLFRTKVDTACGLRLNDCHMSY